MHRGCCILDPDKCVHLIADSYEEVHETKAMCPVELMPSNLYFRPEDEI
jgi:hypothetical protein